MPPTHSIRPPAPIKKDKIPAASKRAPIKTETRFEPLKLIVKIIPPRRRGEYLRLPGFIAIQKHLGGRFLLCDIL